MTSVAILTPKGEALDRMTDLLRDKEPAPEGHKLERAGWFAAWKKAREAKEDAETQMDSDAYRKRAEIYKKTGFSVSAGLMLSKLAQIEALSGKMEKARQTFKEAVELLEDAYRIDCIDKMMSAIEEIEKASDRSKVRMLKKLSSYLRQQLCTHDYLSKATLKNNNTGHRDLIYPDLD